jgi:pre-rRNA-processing protein TSR1
LCRRSRAKEDKEFPDEVDTPVDTPARVRFQKYRGLKSMRTSPWDPYENLPVDYQKISQFKNLMASRMRARAEGGMGVQPGKYVTVWLRVPMAFAEKALAEAAAAGAGGADASGEIGYQPLVIGGLLKYENKMAMMHYNVTRVRDDGDVIKSKDTLVLMCGMRRFEIRPIFSEAKGSSDKHKLLRFLPAKAATMASCYAPVTWGPAPVLILKKQRSGVMTLVAAGRVAAPDANRIALKRIVLTALPYKIKKRKATVRFMFFNPDDIRWFKPVELWTKEVGPSRREHEQPPAAQACVARRGVMEQEQQSLTPWTDG